MGTLGTRTRNGKKPAPRTAKARGKSPSRGAGAGAQSVRRAMAQADAVEQNKAITDILRVIGSSPGELQPVFDTILSHAMRLCDAGLGTVGLYDGKHYRHVAQRGGTAEYAKWLFSEPFKPGPKSTIGRMIVQRLPFHAPDYRELPEFRERKPRAVATVELGGARTYLAVPLLKDGRVIGAITIRRAEVRPFTKKQIDLVSTFASQAVIAIENARLFNETREALEQQTATADILRVITGSPTDLTPVMAAVVENAARLADADHALIGQAEGSNLRWLAAYGCALPGGTRPITRDVPSGRAMLDLQTTQVEDVAQLNDPSVERAYRELGVRSIFATPLVREGRAIGVLLLRRTTVRPFTDKHMALLRTFADQAAIAIENVRLFNETKESLERQTATSEILRVIAFSARFRRRVRSSRSPTSTSRTSSPICRTSCARP